MLTRYILANIEEALLDTPVILINGSRQAGKSTLVQSIAQSQNFTYLTFDDAETLALAKANPENFLKGFPRPLILDEVQRAPEIFLAIKLLVDRDRKPGQFLLTGSANVTLLPRIADSLAGRMEIIPLHPFSQTEIFQTSTNFIDLVFGSENLTALNVNNQINVWQQALQGGYPEILQRATLKRQQAWYNSYISSILLRDVRDIVDIESIENLPLLFNIIAARATQLSNFAELSRSAKIPQTTLKRYVTMMQTIFLISLLKPWSINSSKRLTKAPKIMLNDSGLLAHLLGLNKNNLQQHPNLRGMLLENFIFTEISKQSSWSETHASLFHFRTTHGYEVDLLLESFDKCIVGIEIKSSNSISANDFKGLQHLAEMTSKKFHRGVVLYTGEKIIPFGEKMIALPVNCLYC